MGTYLKFLKKYESRRVKKRGLTITVSGLAGSGKDTVAKEIARVFKLKFVNAGDIQRKFAEKEKISLPDSSKKLPAEVDYQMDLQTLKLAVRGGYVIAARLAGWVAGDFADCRIFIRCPQKIRIQRVMKRDCLPLNQAIKMIKERDIDDQKRYWRLYKINLKNKKIYDLIIDNNKSTLKELKRKTIQAVKKFLKEKYEKRKK